MTIPFQKGSGQRFCQPSGTGIDLGFFELDDLSKPSPEEDVFPLVISAETRPSPHLIGEHINGLQGISNNFQITQAVLEKKNTETFQVKVIRQILWIDGVRYELQDIYGIGSSSVEGFKDDDSGKECVICMTEPKDTLIVPCRHMVSTFWILLQILKAKSLLAGDSVVLPDCWFTVKNIILISKY